MYRKVSEEDSSTARAKFQALQSRRHAQPDLPLKAERLQCDLIVGAAHQHIAASPDTNRGTSLRTGIVAGEIAGTQ